MLQKRNWSYLLKAAVATTALFVLAGCGPNVEDPLELTDTDNKQGPENAELTLVKYSDFQCPACAAFSPLVKQALAEYPDELQFVYRHYPLTTIHPNALPAAYAAEAADEQDKFWEFHDLLFARQADWSRSGGLTDTFLGFAEELGLDAEQFEADYKAKVDRDKIRYDMRAGNMLGIQGTPTFVLNGELVPTVRNYEQFKAILEAELNEVRLANGESTPASEDTEAELEAPSTEETDASESETAEEETEPTETEEDAETETNETTE